MTDLFGQGDFTVRFDWGMVGAQATLADVAVVVDVLSFSTSVTVAVERGMAVYPYIWKGPQAAAFAAGHDAVLAVGRLEAGASSEPSLSPARLLTCTPFQRLVLPSPNGSSIAAALQESGAAVVAGCLRNADAVATWLARRLENGASVAIIAAGERWSHDDSLRPALEDHLGAGAILSGLVARGFGGGMSPEAWAAVELFESAAPHVEQRMRDCVGGRELAGRGFESDVAVAAEMNGSTLVPVLIDGAFVSAS